MSSYTPPPASDEKVLPAGTPWPSSRPTHSTLFSSSATATPDARWNFVEAVGTPVEHPGGLGNGVSLTYSFLETLPAYASYEVDRSEPMDAAMRAAAESVLAHVAELVDIDFTRVADQDGQITVRDIRAIRLQCLGLRAAFFTTVDHTGFITDASEGPHHRQRLVQRNHRVERCGFPARSLRLRPDAARGGSRAGPEASVRRQPGGQLRPGPGDRSSRPTR